MTKIYTLPGCLNSAAVALVSRVNSMFVRSGSLSDNNDIKHETVTAIVWLGDIQEMDLPSMDDSCKLAVCITLLILDPFISFNINVSSFVWMVSTAKVCSTVCWRFSIHW